MCVVALCIQRAMRMRHIVIRGLFGFTIFFHIISQRARLTEKVIEHKMCVLFCLLQGLAETFLILRTERDKIKNLNWSLCKVPVIQYKYQQDAAL